MKIYLKPERGYHMINTNVFDYVNVLDKAADAAWREYEDKERKKRRYAEGRMRERPPSSISKRDSCG